MMKRCFFVFILPLFFACNKQVLNQEPGKSAVLFQVAYLNNAWGYRHHGWIIDTLGHVRVFDQPPAWNFADSAGSYSELKMNQNLSQLNLNTVQVINRDELKKMSQKALKAELGILSTPKNVMADAGILIYSVIIYHPVSGKWKETLLFQQGDWETKNESSEASELYNWLSSIYQEISL